MKVFCGIVIASGVLALAAAAQEMPLQTNVQMDKMKMELEQLTAEARVMSIGGGVMGPAVKGAPYSADEVRESTQVLGDGTTIHNESKVSIYRDGEGRVRRETPNEISIWDPSAGTNYVLNPKTMTARKMSLNFVLKSTAGPNGGGEMKTFSFSYNTIREPAPHMVVMSDEPGAAAAGAVVSERAVATGVATASGSGPAMLRVERRQRGKVDSLGTQTMEGVKAEGERVTSTIEAGAIGNDRPIQTVTERWYSAELQTNIMTKRTDPRMGDEVFRLTNIHRGEPSPVLFEVPPGYTIVNQK